MRDRIIPAPQPTTGWRIWNAKCWKWPCNCHSFSISTSSMPCPRTLFQFRLTELSMTRSEPQAAYTRPKSWVRSEEHTSELQSRGHLVCRLLQEKKNKNNVSKKI